MVRFERMYTIHLFFFGDVFTAVIVVDLSDPILQEKADLKLH